MWGFYFWLTDVIKVCPLLMVNVVWKTCEDNRNRSKGEKLCLEPDTFSTWFSRKFWKQIAAFLCWDDRKSVADAFNSPTFQVIGLFQEWLHLVQRLLLMCQTVNVRLGQGGDCSAVSSWTVISVKWIRMFWLLLEFWLAEQFYGFILPF